MTAFSLSTPVWRNAPPVSVTQTSQISKGDTATLSHLSLGVHSGTHVDAPAHFIPGGIHVDSFDLNLLIGEALVVDAGDAATLSADILRQLSIPKGAKRVLFRTKNSLRWHNEEYELIEDYVGITKEGAEWLVSHGVKLIGTDYLSVCAFQDNVTAHRILLGAGIVLVEGLNLYDIPRGSYQLICLPLKIAGGEGAPARVVLVEQTD